MTSGGIVGGGNVVDVGDQQQPPVVVVEMLLVESNDVVLYCHRMTMIAMTTTYCRLTATVPNEERRRMTFPMSDYSLVNWSHCQQMPNL